MKRERTSFEYQKSLKNKKYSKKNVLTFADLYINRPLASLIVRIVYNTGIKPNHLTYISLLFGLAGAILFTRGHYTAMVIAAFLIQISSIIDGADGILARAKGISSRYGAHLDLLFDRIIDFFTFSGLAIGTSRIMHSSELLFIGLFASGLYLLQINLFYITKHYKSSAESGETGEFRALMFWILFILILFNRPDIFLYAGIITSTGICLIRFIYFVKLGTRKNLAAFSSLDQPDQPEKGQN